MFFSNFRSAVLKTSTCYICIPSENNASNGLSVVKSFATGQLQEAAYGCLASINFMH